MSRSSRPVGGLGGRRRLLLFSFLGYAVAVVLGVLLSGTLREPLLESLGYGLLTLAVLLCAALAGSWWFLAAGTPLLVVMVVSADDSQLGFAIIGAILTVPVVFGLLAVAVAVGRVAQRGGLSPRVLGSATVACIVLALGVGILDAVRPPVDTHPERPLRVDWRNGTYERIALRSSTAALIARLGRPAKRGIHEPAEPI